MLRQIKDRNIWVIYATISLLGVAYGTSIAVLAVHLAAHGIPKLAMGGLAAAFALGIMCCSVPAGWLVRRLSARTTLLLGLIGYAICVASFPALTTTFSLSVARFFDGAFSACIWVAAETMLLTRSDRENKGLVMSLYAIALAIGYVLGPILSTLLVPAWGTGATFVFAGVLGSAGAAVVFFALERDARKGDAIRRALGEHGVARSNDGYTERATRGPRGGRDDDGEDLETAAGSLPPPGRTFWRTKTSCMATFSYGYFQASVVLFLPLYLIESKGVPAERTFLVTAYFAAGMLAMSTWAGRLGDRHGHLLVMRLLAGVGATMVASFVLLESFAAMCAAVFVAGATLASISPVSLALQGVVTPKAELGRANAFYNASYAVGMLLGPPLSSVVFTRFGGAAMLIHLAALWTGFVGLTLAFAADDPRHRSEASVARAMVR